MSRKRHSVDQIIGKLRQADVELGQGKTVEEAWREFHDELVPTWLEQHPGRRAGNKLAMFVAY